MRYIRFLKSPKLQNHEIKALITITSDLGDDFFHEDALLSASVCSASPNGEIYLRKGLEWKAGMRSLQVNFRISDSDIDWPARVHVTLRNAPRSDHFEKHHDGVELPNIISAWSDILDPPNNVLEAAKYVERKFTPLSNRLLCIWEETGESIARHVWDAGIALAAYVDRIVALQDDGLPLVEEVISSATFKTLRVLELGAGCGILGISLAQLIPDCRVLLTDLPEAREIAQRNIDATNCAMSSTVSFQELDWEKPLPRDIQDTAFDLLLVADCTYNPDSGPALVKTLKALVVRNPKAVVLLSMKVRHRSELVFFELMKQARLEQRFRLRIPLPEQSDEDEAVQVYVFHDKERPVYAGSDLEEVEKSVHFWPE